MEQGRCGNAKAVVAKGAQAHGAKVGIADGDGLRCAPLLVDLLARAEEIHIALEGRGKQLVPVFQIGQKRQGLRAQLVGAGAKHIGHGALVDEQGHLRLAHHQHAAVLDFHVLHGKAPGQGAVLPFSPLDDVNKLFLEKVHQGHGALRL